MIHNVFNDEEFNEEDDDEEFNFVPKKIENYILQSLHDNINNL